MTPIPPAQWPSPTRRRILMTGASVGTLALSGCDLLSTNPSGHEVTHTPTARTRKGKEAPKLAKLASQGKIPQVEKRLPAHPVVLKPRKRPGRYGGELSLVTLEAGSGDFLNCWIGYENLLRWKPGARRLTPDQVISNVARSFDIGKDGAEYTFHLRPGMRWSDGSPFTADDVLFWYEDVLLNKELSPGGIPDFLDTGGDTPLVVEKVDDHTVIFRFSSPAGLFLNKTASQNGGAFASYPAHYMKEFHKKYADNIDELVKKSKLDSWTDLFVNQHNLWENPDLPTLGAWTMREGFSANTERVVAERNPYYWKTDTDGSQLPYIDRLAFTLVNEEEAAVLKVTNGEVDVVERSINELRNKPIYARGRSRGHYDFFDTVPQEMNRAVFMLNLTHKDPVLRKIFSDKRFRVGLSHAINRKEIIDTVFARQGEPWQAAPRRISGYFNQKLATQYTEYDVKLAGELLDKVLPDKDSHGIRLLPEGKPLFFNIEVSTAQREHIDTAGLVRKYWRQVGVNVQVRSSDNNLWYERIDANEHDACVAHGGGGLSPTQTAFYYVPTNFNTRYAVPWYRWVQDPDDPRAEKPPPPTLRQIRLYDRLLSTADQQEQTSLMAKILDGAAEQFYAMGIVLRNKDYGVASTRLSNTPGFCLTGWNHAHLAPENPQQFFFDNS